MVVVDSGSEEEDEEPLVYSTPVTKKPPRQNRIDVHRGAGWCAECPSTAQHCSEGFDLCWVDRTCVVYHRVCAFVGECSQDTLDAGTLACGPYSQNSVLRRSTQFNVN